jgi:hypothetical protein
MTNPNEPTLTCSEVVERLATECHFIPKDDWEVHFDTEKAEAILHSWRERRVQELGDCLREEIMQARACVSEMRTMPTNSDIGKEALLKSAAQRIKYMEDVLNGRAEWREQIRKGAKHE